MLNETQQETDAVARVLAMMVAANGRVDAREMSVLHELDAFRRIGVSAEHFAELTKRCLQQFGNTCECSWLPASEESRIDELLDAVRDPAQRLLLCRLSAAVIGADGEVTQDERLIFNHALTRWHIDRDILAQP